MDINVNQFVVVRSYTTTGVDEPSCALHDTEQSVVRAVDWPATHEPLGGAQPAEIITEVLPEMTGKIMVTALNVPVPDGSTIDMVAESSRPVTAEEVNDVMKGQVTARFSDVIEYVADPIVSSDVRLNSHSGIFDSLATLITGDNMVKTITWFNNGWGYSHRVVEVAAEIASRGGGE